MDYQFYNVNLTKCPACDSKLSVVESKYGDFSISFLGRCVASGVQVVSYFPYNDEWMIFLNHTRTISLGKCIILLNDGFINNGDYASDNLMHLSAFDTKEIDDNCLKRIINMFIFL